MALLFFFIGNSAFAAPGFTATLDRSAISLGETATLSLIFTDISTQQQPGLPAIANVGINYRGQSTQMTSVNGQVTSQITYSYELTPATVGEFSIPVIAVKSGQTTFASQALKLKVVQGQAPPPDEKSPAFLKLIVPKNQVYFGEPITVQIQLYCQDARDVSMPQIQSDGFTVGNIPQPTQSQTRIGNEAYHLVAFKVAVAATKVGSLTLGPATCNLKLLMGPRNIFGQFTQAQPVALKSEPQMLNVLSLPTAKKPPGFNGAIGNFNMLFAAGPTNVAVGDPITIKVKISGRGALDLLSLPSQSDWREFKTYPATSKVESSDPLGLEGAKTFEQVVVPQNSGITELPPFVFSFFNPERKRYQSITNSAIPLVVRPTAATPQPTVFSSNSEPGEKSATAREIVHIKPQIGTIHSNSAPLLKQPWFLALQLIAPLAWIAGVISRKRREQLQNNPHLRREREVSKIVAQGLKELSRQAAANESDKFFATLFRLLQEQLGERLDLPASAITEAVVEEQLRPGGVSPETLALIHELFQACNQARYAQQSSRAELALFIPKTADALTALKNLKHERALVRI
ncbi:MAG: BatD family protein [Verrucomicrobiota bacterium]